MEARGIARSIPFTATRSPKRRVRPRASIASWPLLMAGVRLPQWTSLAFGSLRETCDGHELDLERQASRQRARRFALEIDLRDVGEAAAVALGERVVGRERGLLRDGAHAARDRARHPIDPHR